MNTSKDFLRLPEVCIQPVLAREGTPSIDPQKLQSILPPGMKLAPLITIQNLEHWRRAIMEVPNNIDAIALLSNPCYPTEIWNEDPEPLKKRALPVVFWPLLEYDEPDFWKWSCTDMLRSHGIECELPDNQQCALDWMRALALKKFLRGSKMLVFGKQNFPWNADTSSALITRTLGLAIESRPLESITERIPQIPQESIQKVLASLTGATLADVRREELEKAAAFWIATREILIQERAVGFGVNCFGDLIPGGSRIVPCLAQHIARQEGFVASCDGDFCAMVSLAILEKMTGQPGMMSNLYPLTYRGALTGHFGNPLEAGVKWKDHPLSNLGRIAHCGFIGVVPPAMTTAGTVRLRDWGGTYEIKRDGQGCGIDGDLRSETPFTCVEIKFDGKTLLLTHGTVLETTRHPGMPHCESSVLLEFSNLPAFVKQISREHIALGYGDWLETLRIAARVLGLDCVEIQ